MLVVLALLDLEGTFRKCSAFFSPVQIGGGFGGQYRGGNRGGCTFCQSGLWKCLAGCGLRSDLAAPKFRFCERSGSVSRSKTHSSTLAANGAATSEATGSCNEAALLHGTRDG